MPAPTTALHLAAPVDPRPRDAAAAAVGLERAGYRSLWVPETSGDPFLAAAMALDATERIQVGTGIAVAFARSPFVTAQASWELSRMSGGRFVLGLGTQVKGHAERRFSMPWAPPVARLREYVSVVRACWRSFQTGRLEPVQGQFHRFDLLPPVFDPGPIDHPRIRVHLAAVNREMIALAGEIADGLIAHPLHTADWLRDALQPALHDGLTRAGRAAAEVAVHVPVWLVCAAGAEQVGQLAAVRRQIAFYGATRTYRTVFESLGADDLPAALHRRIGVGDLDGAAALVPERIVRSIALVCEPGDEAEALAQRYGGSASECILWPPTPWPLDSVDAARVIARLSALPSGSGT